MPGLASAHCSLIMSPQTIDKTAGCKRLVRYKVHKNVDSRFEPSLDVDVHREELRSIPLKPITPRHPRILWMIRLIARRTRES
jgi:hypothetical protein